MNALERPAPSEIAPYYQRYIDLAEGRDLLEALMNASERTWSTANRIGAAKAGHAYAPGKWTIEQLLQHVVDCERVFTYRALCFARFDPTPLPGFDENAWGDATARGGRSLKLVMAEHDAVRAATLAFFRGCTAEELMAQGTANGNPFSVRALGWAIAGHAVHHVNILNERYL